MANPAVTYTFANSTTSDATQVNQNFTDLINGATDGTKDYSISAFTAAGTATLNGAVNLGNGTSKDISFLGSLATSIPIKTTATYDLGSSTLGMRAIYLGLTSFTTKLATAATASWTFTFPITAGSAYQRLQTDGSGNSSWVSDDSSSLCENVGIACSVGTNALTISLKDKGGSDCSATSTGRISFGSSTATSGVYNVRAITGALSTTISSGSTAGHASAKDEYIYVYALDNAGTVELGWCSQRLDEGSLQTSTAEGGAGAADSKTVFYSTTARSNIRVRLLARLKSNQTTAGTWTAVPTEISLFPFLASSFLPKSEIKLTTPGATTAGWGSTNTKIRRYTVLEVSTGTALTLTQSATSGDSITVNADGWYFISVTESSTAAEDYGISINASSGTTGITSLTVTNGQRAISTLQANNSDAVSTLEYCIVGDIIRPHGNGSAASTSANSQFRVIKVA